MTTIKLLKTVKQNLQRPHAWDGVCSGISRPHCVLGEIKLQTGLITIIGSPFDSLFRGGKGKVFSRAESKLLWSDKITKSQAIKILDAAIKRYNQKGK